MRGVLVPGELFIAHMRAKRDDRVHRVGVDDERRAHGWRFIRHRFHLVALCVVFREHEHHFGIIEHGAHLCGGIRLIHGNRHTADRHDRHVEGHPFPPGVGDDRNGLARTGAPANQALGDRDDFVAELHRRERLPDTVGVLVPDHRTVGVALGAALNEVEQVDVRIDRLVQWGLILLDDAGVARAVFGACRRALCGTVFTHTYRNYTIDATTRRFMSRTGYGRHTAVRSGYAYVGVLSVLLRTNKGVY